MKHEYDESENQLDRIAQLEERVAELENLTKQLSRRLDLHDARHPFRSLGKKSNSMAITTKVPGRY